MSNYKELVVWQKAIQLVTDIYKLTKFFQKKKLMVWFHKCKGQQYPYRVILLKDTTGTRIKNSVIFYALQEAL